MASHTLTVALVAAACGLPPHPQGETLLTGLVMDSRKVKAGHLFAALPGEQQDGHDFIPMAVAAGCGAVLASRPVACEVPLLLVEDVEKAMSLAAKAWRKLVNPTVIGVTGSSGKTTIKEMLHAVLRQQFATHATAGNLNNHLGVPITLLAMAGDCQMAVVEMGMNHSGEIAHLASLAQPDCGIITNIFPAHLEGLGSMEAIARAKGELLDHLTGHKLAVVPAAGEQSELLQKMCQGRKLTFGAAPHGDWQWQKGTTSGQAMLLGPQGEKITLHNLLSHGDHLVQNATAVAALCHWLGVSLAVVEEGLNTFLPPAGRGGCRQSQLGNWLVIDDCYNANPGSVQAALRNLAAKTAPGRKLAVLGDMLELGETTNQLHASMAQDILNAGLDVVFTAGPLMANLHQALLKEGSLECHHRENPADWQDNLVGRLKDGDIILVKGSRGMRLERIVQEIIGGR